MFKIETVNKDVCEKLNKITFGQFSKELFVDMDMSWIDKNNNKSTISIQYDLLQVFTNDLIKNKFRSNKSYSYSNGSSSGRLFVKHNGIQRLQSKLRGVLCDGVYTDLDMVNAHPTILLYLCKLNHFQSYNLEMYIMNREQKINELMNETNKSRTEIKNLILTSMNSDIEINKYKIDNKYKTIKSSFFLGLDKEFKEIQKSFLKQYPEYEKVLKQLGKTENIQGKVLNKVLCDYENKILQEGINKLYENEYINNTDDMILMFDGLMLENKNIKVDNKLLIDKLNDNEYNIKWDIKEHDISIKTNLEDINVDDNDDILSGKFDKLIDIAELMNKTVLKDKLIYCGDILYYIEDNVLITKSKIIKQAVLKKLKEQDFYIPCFTGHMELIVDYNKMEDVFKWILLDVEKNNNFIDNIWDNTLQKLCFENGYYDFKKSKFINEYEDLTTPIKISKKVIMKSNPNVRKELFKRVLYPIFTVKKEGDERFHLMEYMLYRLARIMAGHIEDKIWMTFEGLRDSGKGVLCDLFKNSFGKYIYSINASNFLMKRGDEDAKTLSWMLDLQFTRLAITQEIQLEEKTVIDGNKIKKMNSGGDRLNARKNYQDEIEFRIQSSLVMCINDLPEIKPSDAKQKCIPFKMKSKFVKDVEKDAQYNNYSYYLLDGNIKNNFINKDEVINEFTLLIFEYYNRKDTSYPEELFKSIKDSDEDEDDEMKLINSFKINSEVKDYTVSNIQLKEVLKDKDIRITLKKAKTLLCGKGASLFRSGGFRGLKDLMIIEDD
jgi:hypothetical protein